jgi:hypothetical protein
MEDSGLKQAVSPMMMMMIMMNMDMKAHSGYNLYTVKGNELKMSEKYYVVYQYSNNQT